MLVSEWYKLRFPELQTRVRVVRTCTGTNFYVSTPRSGPVLENDLEELAAASQRSSKGRSRTNGTFGSVPVPLGIERIISFGPPFTINLKYRKLNDKKN